MAIPRILERLAVGRMELLDVLAEIVVRPPGRPDPDISPPRCLQRIGDRIDPDEVEWGATPRCASAGGLNLHANVAVHASDRSRLERLARYILRPALAADRLSQLPEARLLYRLKHPWRDGT